MGIAFLPIEIDVQLPNEQKLIEFCREHQIPTPAPTESKHSLWWHITPVLFRGKREDLYGTDPVKSLRNGKVYFNRYNKSSEKAAYLNNIDKVFPEIPYMLEQLPFKEIFAVTLLEQITYVDYHSDNKLGADENNKFSDEINDPSELGDLLEPRRYNILMTKHEYKECFFVSEKMYGEKIYPEITKENPCHAISMKHYYHGANYCGPGKLMLAISGDIVDREKHIQVINYNLEKHKDKAIIF